MKVGIIGAGTWGMAIGHVLERNGHKVFFVRREHERWPKEHSHPDFIVLALPCQVVRERLKTLDVPTAPIISLTKGIEIKTGLRTTQILEQILPDCPRAVISGPNLASEVEKQLPTATVAASPVGGLAKQVQELLHQKTFRVYRSSDMTGVELGGALKNIYAIAGGICEGLQLGENGLAALVTRCLAEMVRISCALGAQKETLFGLSGMGDLMLTAYSGISRNHRVGEALARGEKLDHTLKNLLGVAEGVPTTKAVYSIIEKNKIKAPVLTEVYHVLYENKTPTDALHDLLLRQVEEEVKMKKLLIAPSILAADLANLGAEAKRALDAGADWLHVDIMDGHFVPNISFGSNVVRMLRKEFPSAFLDVHLMITRADRYVKDFVESGANLLTVHVEPHAKHDVEKTIQMIRDLGCKPAISLNPPTSIEAVLPFLSSVELLLCMTVNPGFGGQAFIPEVMEKVRAAHDFIQKNHLNVDIEVDGGINAKTAKTACANGANILVAGTSLFKEKDMAPAIQQLRTSA